tara:strand:- start:262 stop:459 length:198 start_codon:yes stop_codon:yes gene_type:complete
MAVPKKKVSPSRRGKRRSHHSLSKKNIIECPNCGAEMISHNICSSCGFYKKRQVFNIKKAEENKT